jgi:hypothetical protein
MTKEAAENGLANRFLWIWADRKQVLSRPPLYPKNINELVADLEHAISTAQRNYETTDGVGTAIDFNEEALKEWDIVYHMLAQKEPEGFMNQILGRAEAQIVRVSSLYAALDGSLSIKPEHLGAAVAIWDYAEKSAEHIFGDRDDSSTVNRVFQHIKDNPMGLDKTGINSLFSGKVRSAEINESTEKLLAQGKIEMLTEQTSGRDRTIFRPAEKAE